MCGVCVSVQVRRLYCRGGCAASTLAAVLRSRDGTHPLDKLCFVEVFFFCVVPDARFVREPIDRRALYAYMYICSHYAARTTMPTTPMDDAHNIEEAVICGLASACSGCCSLVGHFLDGWGATICAHP